MQTRELCSGSVLQERVAGASSLLCTGLEGANLGSKSFVAQHIFSLEIVGADEGALLRESVGGACCGRLPRVYRPLVSVNLLTDS